MMQPSHWPYVNDFLAILRVHTACGSPPSIYSSADRRRARWTRDLRRDVETVKLTCPPQVYYRLTSGLLVRLETAVVKLVARKGDDNDQAVKARRVLDDLRSWLTQYGTISVDAAELGAVR